MSRTVLTGISGANPLGFMGSLGLLRILSRERATPRLGFLDDGSFHPFFEACEGDIADEVARDASSAPCSAQSWWLSYEKEEKRGVKKVADLKAPPDAFRKYLDACVAHWCGGDLDAAAYAAAFGTSVARDGNGNTKPTALHFTAANQQFLETAERIRALVTPEWARRSLLEGATKPGPNLRWDPGAERNWALMASDPTEEGTRVDAPLEWLAFRALPLVPAFPVGARVVTTAVSGRGDEMTMTWPLWSAPVSLATARSLLVLDWSQIAGHPGVFAISSSAIRRTAQGFGNFGPAAVRPARHL